jgi:hypothetical protein
MCAVKMSGQGFHAWIRGETLGYAPSRLVANEARSARAPTGSSKPREPVEQAFYLRQVKGADVRGH